ncbi:cache domain-containing protein [Lebetimonas sp. JS085]|nr:cache domain-containing protein [Lebetimonas sp. JS085]
MELKKVTHVYNEILKRVRKFYTTRGYANINSYGIKKAFEKKDIKALHDLSLPRWKIITKENRYLTTFAFYDNNGKLLTYFGQKAQLKLPYIKGKKFPYDGFWYGEGKFFYHTVSEARDKNSNIIGYVVFVIDPRYFLSQIRKLIDMDAYIYYDGYGQNLIFSLHGNDYVKKLIKNKKLSNFKEIKFKKRDYLTYIIKGRGINKKNDFKIIFFQDISNWRMILNKAILQGVIGIILFIIVTAVVINYGFDIILRQLDEVNTKLVNSQKELQKLNKNLQIRVEKEIKERLKKEREVNEKERILLHQSKLASMGEMIGNIAHQWRQPLTELSLILISMELHSERNNLTKEKFKLKIQEANEAIAFMSKTIDDFRNFFVSNLIEK